MPHGKIFTTKSKIVFFIYYLKTNVFCTQSLSLGREKHHTKLFINRAQNGPFSKFNISKKKNTEYQLNTPNGELNLKQ